MADGTTAAEAAALYDQDFYAWTQHQAEALRRAGAGGSPAALDLGNLAEEIESLGRNLRRELQSRLATIIEHLLKLEFSPAPGPRPGWMSAIRRERAEVERLLEESPSLRQHVEALVERENRRMARQVGLDLRDRGEVSAAVAAKLSASYGAAQVLGEEWWPPPRTEGDAS